MEVTFSAAVSFDKVPFPDIISSSASEAILPEKTVKAAKSRELALTGSSKFKTSSP